MSAAEPDPRFVERYGPWVVVLGASEGTGAEFARLVAAKGANVLAVARREPPLEALKADLAPLGAEVRLASIDLAELGASERLEAACEGLDVGLVIFNAGGDSVGGRFLDSSYTTWRRLLDRNIDFLTRTLHHFAARLAARGRGGLLLVGSEAALGGIGRIALYSASKGYALNLGEALWRELGPKGVDVLNLLIGATDTPKLRGVLARNGLDAGDVALTPPAAVARLGLDNLGAGPTLAPNHMADHDHPLTGAGARRARVVRESLFLNHFYGPE